MDLIGNPMFKLNVIVFLLSVTEAGVQLLMPVFLKNVNVPVGSVGYLISLLAVGRLISRGPGAYLYGIRVRAAALAVAVLLTSASSIVFVLLPPVILAGALLLIHGISYGLATTMLLALCMEIIRDSREMAGMMGWYTAFTSAGNFLGSFLSGYIADRFGLPASFAVMSVFAGIAVLVVTSVYWPAPVLSREQGVEKRGPMRRMDCMGAMRSAVKALAGMPLPVYLAIILAFYINFLNQLTNAFYPLWAIQCGLTLTLVGLLKSVNAGTGTLVRLFLGLILSKVNYRVINNFCLVFLCLSTSLMSFVTFLPALLGIFITVGATRGVIRATSATYAAESTPPNTRMKGMASGIYSAGLDIGNILGPMVGGIVVSLVGLGSVFWVLPVFLLLPCLVLTVQAGRTGKEAGGRVFEK